MLASARAFLEGIIDYAGLFPPADLPLIQALANYQNYRQSPEGWLLGRFICPAARLPELTALHGTGSREQGTGTKTPRSLAPLRLSVLGRGGKDAGSFRANVRADVADIVKLAEALGSDVIVENYEVKLPVIPHSATDADLFANELSGLVDAVRHFFTTAPLVEPAPFFEFSVLQPDTIKTIAARLIWDHALMEEMLRDMLMPGETQWSRVVRAGWKLRCGGPQASAFPSTGQVASVLFQCCSADIPWKGAAGMHHPIRRFDTGLKTPRHGFVNIFAAGILAQTCKLSEARLAEVLSDEDAGHFVFDESGFTWNGHRATIDDIQTARRSLVTSFGSSSFDEPRNDLRQLGWI